MSLKLHKSITQDRIIDAVERSLYTLDDPGICITCGQEQSPVEPDARRFRCDHCGCMDVFGAEELLIETFFF